MRFCLLILILGCGTIPIKKPNATETIVHKTAAGENVFVTVDHAERVPGKHNMDVLRISDKYNPSICEFAKEAQSPQIGPISGSQLFVNSQNRDDFLETVTYNSTIQPGRTYHLIFFVQKWSDNPFSFLYILLHGLTIGLVPYYVSSDASIEYIGIRNGLQIEKKRVPFDMSTISWSPLMLTGNIKKPRDVFVPELSRLCLKFIEPLAKPAMAN